MVEERSTVRDPAHGVPPGREETLLHSLVHSGPAYYAFVGGLLGVIAWAAIAYATQLTYGLETTAMRNYVSWGIYITNFVFFIGISHAGTLISAILRVTGAKWRRPITRMAEAITVFALMVGAPMVIIDLGRPDRLVNLLRYGRLQSPILWDVLSITTYLAGSLLYLYLPLIPDLAVLRDKLTALPSWRRWIYGLLALGWRGTPDQRRRLEKAIGVMAILIIPIAVSVHTVVSWIFGMTLRAGWHSTIFGPYFVVGAIFSGVAAIITAMAIFRRLYHLEGYITPLHFRNLGYLLLTLDLVYAYFTFSEYLTVTYAGESADVRLIGQLLFGEHALIFWLTMGVGLLIPAVLLVVPSMAAVRRITRIPLLKPRPIFATAAVAIVGLLVLSIQRPSQLLGLEGLQGMLRWAVGLLMALFFISILPSLSVRPIASIVIASLLVNLGLWLKRYIIIVPTLLHPFLPIQWVPWEWAIYRPTWVEWSITAGAFAAFTLLYTWFSKLFPVVSLWETREEAEMPRREPLERMVS